jgi:hypothetical protein
MSQQDKLEAWLSSQAFSWPTPLQIWEASRREALEEAAQECDKIDRIYNQYRKQSDNPTYHEGKSDGAENCAIAIRALAADTKE